jgi:hypothetical protein
VSRGTRPDGSESLSQFLEHDLPALCGRKRGQQGTGVEALATPGLGGVFTAASHGVRAHPSYPTAPWTAQQALEAFPWRQRRDGSRD